MAPRGYMGPAPPMRQGLTNKQYKQVKKIVNSDKQFKTKCVAVANSDTIVAAGALYEITLIPEGDDFNQRSSDRIMVKVIEGRYTITWNQLSDGTDHYTTFRLMVVRSKVGPTGGANLPTAGNLFTDIDLDKYQVLFDRPYSLNNAVVDNNPLSNSIVNGIHFKIKFYNKKIPGILVGYDDDASATAAQNNPMYLLIVGDQASTCDFNGNTKIKWTDKD